jgi:DNA-binding transcriptional MocR family regulator
MLPSRTALIKKVTEEIRQRVADGTYPYRLPAATALCKELGVNRDTAWRAVRILRHEGLLVAAGQRTYAASAYEARSHVLTSTAVGAEQPLAVPSAASAAAAAQRPWPAPQDQRGPAMGMAPISADDLRKAIRQPGAQFMTVEEVCEIYATVQDDGLPDDSRQ